MSRIWFKEFFIYSACKCKCNRRIANEGEKEKERKPAILSKSGNTQKVDDDDAKKNCA